jgi:hypothetical protein
MKDKLRTENEFSVGVDFADRVFAEVQFLEVDQVFECCNGVEVLDVVFVEDELAEVFV